MKHAKSTVPGRLLVDNFPRCAAVDFSSAASCVIEEVGGVCWLMLECLFVDCAIVEL